ncbi:MAG: chemotaxis protein CheA, partial [Candidatus Cloacimonetes bacterium]|nr:chemotaxis protein CheA [Candidatus Cloacimonadota bacterium]
ESQVIDNLNVNKKAMIVPSAERQKNASKDSIRIKTEKLDYLIDTIGELVINSNLLKADRNLLNITDIDFLKKLSQFSRVVTELQSASMALRMVPIGNTFQKMKRVVSDYSRQNSKPIELILKGIDTEVDRNIVDSLYDPLVHMIRNSCDHGIENPEERKSKGKIVSGRIELNAYHKGNNIIIDVIDDGKGLNREVIWKKAVEKGVFDESEDLSDSEVFGAIFRPGFSTVEKVTSVSGRGVGMDVVNQVIKQLGGSIKIHSVRNEGTTISIILPLTMAIIDGMFVKVGKEVFIIPIANVTRTLSPVKDSINLIAGKKSTLSVDGRLIPIVKMHEAFKIDNAVVSLDDAILIIIHAQGIEYALMVDELLGIQSVVVKNLGDKFKNLRGISAATILGNGNVGLIVDVNSLTSVGSRKSDI